MSAPDERSNHRRALSPLANGCMDFDQQPVGWVERSDTHRLARDLRPFSEMGIAGLDITSDAL
jgi:hypothetical protein